MPHRIDDTRSSKEVNVISILNLLFINFAIGERYNLSRLVVFLNEILATEIAS
ncbi:MAG: hypothetical protein ACQES4_10355 [Bacillota bacterium]